MWVKRTFVPSLHYRPSVVFKKSRHSFRTERLLITHIIVILNDCTKIMKKIYFWIFCEAISLFVENAF